MKYTVRTAWVFSVMLATCCFQPYEASADVFILAPAGASASTTYTDPGFVSPQYLIDGSGLTSTGTIWEAVHSVANDRELFWHSDVNIDVSAQWLEFDLGAEYHVANALLWQLSQHPLSDRGMAEFRISVAGENRVFSTYSIGNVLNRSTNLVEEAVQVVPLAARYTRYVRIEIQSNWGAGGIVGLGEVRFEVSTPEPPPTAMILLPLAVSASSRYEGWGEPWALIDGSGLSGIGRQATHTTASAYYLFWHSDGNGVANQWLEFDLGAAYDVTNALIWQLGQQNWTSRGVRGFTLSVAGTDHVFSTYSTDNELAKADEGFDVPVRVVPLVAKSIRYVKIEIQSNWGDGIVGLSEVRFEVTPSALNTTDVTLAPVGASVSTYHDYENHYTPQWLINGSGLTGSGRQATHSNANGLDLFWHSQVGVDVSQQWVEFDLGAPYDVTNALLWQLSQSGLTARGIKEFTVKVAGADHAFSTYSTGNLLNRASAQTEQFPQVMPLVAKNIRYVRLEVQSNWGADGIVGLNEVRFEVAPPETNAFIRIPVADTVSSFEPNYPGPFVIDGSGLTGTGLAATHGNGLGSSSMWLSNYGTVANQWVEFDLGAEHKLVAAAVWQYNQTELHNGGLSAEFLKRGVRLMTIYTAGGDKSYSEYGTVQLARGTGSAAEPAQLVSLKAKGVRYVKFAVNTSWGFPDMVGLSEVRFLYKRTGTLLSLR